jgi:tetratricopeptide (TPR) repeat protein
LRLQAASQLLVYGLRQGMSRERADEIFAEGRALAASRGSVREQVRLLYGIAINYLNLGELRRSISYCEEALALADASGEPELRWVPREILEFDLLGAGELDAALRVSDEQMELIQTDPLIGLEMVGISGANSWSHRMMILIDLGRFDEAEEASRRFGEMARRSNESELVCWNDCFLSRLYLRRGDVQSALSIARRAIESAERSGSLLGRVGSHGHYGAALAENGEWEAAIQSLDLALELMRANTVGHFWESDFAAALAEAHLGLANGPRARELADAAIGIARRMQMRVAEARALLARSRVLLALDGATAREEIESALDGAEALVHSTGARAWAPQILVERARLAGALSDVARREQWLREAHRLFTALGATGHAERVASLLAEAGAPR